MHMTTSMKVYKFIARIGTVIAKTEDVCRNAIRNFLKKIGVND